MSDRIRYKCKNCSYEFTRRADLEIRQCPYCSKYSTLEIMKGDFAARIIDSGF